jgi:hypothetical protein
VRVALKKLGIQLCKDDLLELFDEHGIDGSGGISLHQFRGLHKAWRSSLTRQKSMEKETKGDDSNGALA